MKTLILVAACVAGLSVAFNYYVQYRNYREVELYMSLARKVKPDLL